MKKLHIGLIFGAMLFSTTAFSQRLSSLGDADTVLAVTLIRGGANVNEVDGQGSTPLLNACRWNNKAMVRLLLNNGATVDNPRSASGRTPLIVGSAYYAGITIVTMLVEKGANVNAKANDGSTALMLAAKFSKAETVDYLLANGADASITDNLGKTALDYANAATNTLSPADLPDSRIDKQDCIVRISRALGR